MPTNYGTKKMVYEKKRATKLPIVILSPAKREFLEHGGIAAYSATATKCYCPDCKKVFDVDPIEIKADRGCSRESRIINTLQNVSLECEEAIQRRELECPECHLSGSFVILTPQDKQDVNDEDMPAGEKEAHINYDGSWRIPPFVQGRYMFEFRDESGKLTRIDDNIMLEHSVLFPSGKVFTWEVEHSQASDLVNHRIMSFKTRIDGRNRTPIGAAQDVVNPFAYMPKNNFNHREQMDVGELHKALNLSVQYTSVPVSICKDPVLGKAFLSDYYVNATKNTSSRYGFNEGLYSGLTQDEAKKMFEETSKLKAHLAIETLADSLPHPVYSDLVKNGLNLIDHKKESTEENTDIDEQKEAIHYYMCVRYPAAVQFAASRAELRAVNYEFAEKRKAEADPSYTAKTATDSARAKFFREEMTYVAEQLTTCDDKVLNEVRMAGADVPTYIFTKDESGKNCIKKVDKYVSPESDNPDNLQLMKDRLSFFVFGLREGYPVPNEIAVKLKDSKTLQPATQATKKLKSSFNMDPIATASNVYTLQKWKITDPNYVKSVLDLVQTQCPEVNRADIRVKGRRIPQPKLSCPFLNANVLAPVRDKTALRFLRLYGQTHDTAAMIKDILDNSENPCQATKWGQFCEDVRLYDDVISNPKVQIIQTKKDMPTESKDETTNADAQHLQNKIQLRNYLENSGSNGLQLAYRDFSPMYGANTVEMINMLAREIKQDIQMDKIKRFAKTEGMDAALAKYATELASFEDPAKAIEEHELFSDRTMVIATRNNKPLFERSLGEIHDELSEIGKKTVTENEYLEFSDKIKAMNQIVQLDLSTLPESQWIDNPTPVPEGTMGEFQFKVLDNRFAYVRLATDLRNCVASMGYFSSAKSGSTLIVAMYNENSQPVACIELCKQHADEHDREWYVSQFEGYRDGVVDRRYVEAFKQWCADHKIDADRDPRGEIKASVDGKKEFFHGAGNADYHNEEFDPVLNTTFANDTAQRKRQARVEKAIELYGGSAETGPNLPAVPDDLQDFSVQ